MENINKIKKLSLWIFIIPFIALNSCLILITNFHQFFNSEDVILHTIPYIDGGVSISRTARVFPTYLIFKPAMFLTSYLLIKYWFYNKEVINHLEKNQHIFRKTQLRITGGWRGPHLRPFCARGGAPIEGVPSKLYIFL